MSLTITQHDDKWRIAIDETWQFENYADFENCLNALLENKEKFGQLQKSKDKKDVKFYSTKPIEG